ncbi:MAG: hypothetical protein M3422_00260 [Actinomycetota bacterium]|nr:hypothetical protein [Actinomycetota bacterium]
MLDWPYPVWMQTSAQFHQQFAFAGMIAGTAACWYATVLHAKDRIWMRSGAPRLGPPAVSWHLRTLVCWFVGAYLLALIPLVASTLITGGLGEPAPLVMASGVLAMIAAVALGYALGTVVPTVATVPLIAVGFYALLVAGNVIGEPMAAVAPVLWFEPQLGERESMPLLVFRIALFLSVAVAAAALAARAMTRVRAWRSLVDVAFCLAVPAVLVTVALLRPPVVYTADPPPSSCVERREIRYCVHSDHTPRLSELVRRVDPVVARFGTKPDNVDEVWDQALTYGRTLAPDRAERIDLVWLQPDGTMEPGMAALAAGLYACDWRGEPTHLQQEALAVAWDIKDFLDTGKPDGSLASMSVVEVQQWLASHQQRLHSCTLTEEQLPGAKTR